MSRHTFEQNHTKFAEAAKKQNLVLNIGFALTFLISMAMLFTPITPEIIDMSIRIGMAIFFTILLVLLFWWIRSIFAKTRSDYITLEVETIIQTTARRTRTVPYSDVRTMISHRKNDQLIGIGLMLSPFDSISFAHYDGLTEIESLLRERLPKTTTIHDKLPNNIKYGVLIPYTFVAIIMLFATLWRSLPFYSTYSIAMVIVFSIWFLSGGPSNILGMNLRKGKKALRFFEIAFAVGCFALLAFAISLTYWFDSSNICSFQNRGDSGCTQFIDRAEPIFSFTGNGSELVYVNQSNVIRKSFGRFFKINSNTLLSSNEISFSDGTQLSRDQSRIAVLDKDIVSIWDSTSKKLLWHLEPAIGLFQNASLSADFELTATTYLYLGEENTQRNLDIWDLEQNSLNSTLPNVRFAKFSPIANHLIYIHSSEEAGRSIHILDIETNTIINRSKLPNTLSHINDLYLSPDGSLIIIFTDMQLAIVETSILTELQIIEFAEDSRWNSRRQVAISYDNSFVVMSRKEEIQTGGENTRDFDTDSTEIEQTRLVAWHIPSGVKLVDQIIETDKYAYIDHVAISPDGSTIGVGTWDGIYLFDAPTLLNLPQP